MTGSDSAKDREVSDLKKQLAKQSLRSINNITARKEDNVDLLVDFVQ